MFCFIEPSSDKSLQNRSSDQTGALLAIEWPILDWSIPPHTLLDQPHSSFTVPVPSLTDPSTP
jgi:hypothetical protein